MNLTEQYHAKLAEREAFVDSQNRLESNLVKSITLVRSVTTHQLEIMDASLYALAATIGFVPVAAIEQAA